MNAKTVGVAAKKEAVRSALPNRKQPAKRQSLSRAQQHAKLIGEAVVSPFGEGEFIQQVNGFGTPVFSQVSSSAGV